jgi:rubrerythrin
MFEQAILAEQFRRLLLKQQEAVQAYARLLKEVDDPELHEQVDQICRDKLRHVRLSERLLEIVP